MAQEFTSIINTSKKQLLDYTGSTLVYQGQAEPSSLSSAAVWSIKKFTYTGDNLTSITWADGTSEEVKIWDDRATYTYS